MIKSIQYLQEIGIKKFQKTFEEFYSDPTRFAEFVLNLQVNLNEWGRMMIKEGLEEIDLQIKNSRKRHYDGWLVDNTNSKELITSLGALKFMKTSYYNKTTGEYKYLLDSAVGFEPGKKITEDAMANMYKEAAQTSYRRSGEMMSKDTVVSKATIKNKLHSLKFPPEVKPEKKKRVEYLYIDADEDHVSLQYRNKKGDLINNNGRKNNCLITKMIYVYEGITNKVDAADNRRHLINAHYFSGIYEGSDNKILWRNVKEYIESVYDVDNIKKIYINGDGGAWIKAGVSILENSTYVLDEFHLRKYVNKAIAHTLDCRDDAKKELYSAIKSGTKRQFVDVCDKLRSCADTEGSVKRVCEAEEYIINNWRAAKIRLRDRNNIKGCSAEGHVSHVLSSRMSSRPMGWSITGADKMAHLRAYYMNGGDMLVLVRMQAKERFVNNIDEIKEDVLSCAKTKMTSNNGLLGKYYDTFQCSVSREIRKYVSIRNHIYGI